jgi:hypothetical protein
VSLLVLLDFPSIPICFVFVLFCFSCFLSVLFFTFLV